MADFCTDCAIKMGFSKPDINVDEIFKNLKTEEYKPCLCEGCGLKSIGRNKDNKLVLIKNLLLTLPLLVDRTNFDMKSFVNNLISQDFEFSKRALLFDYTPS